MKPLTNRQQDVYEYIKKSLNTNKFSPSVREIAEDLGLKSTASVKFHLDNLVELGYITMSAGKSRTIALCHPETSTGIPLKNRVPLVGHVAAGLPILAEEYVEDYLHFDTRGAQGEHFALRVRGESMRDAGILPGDCVVVHHQETAKSGQIVVALFEDEATVKTLRYQGDTPWLMPENPDFQPIDGTHAQILGRVVAVVRQYD